MNGGRQNERLRNLQICKPFQTYKGYPDIKCCYHAARRHCLRAYRKENDADNRGRHPLFWILPERGNKKAPIPVRPTEKYCVSKRNLPDAERLFLHNKEGICKGREKPITNPLTYRRYGEKRNENVCENKRHDN